MAYLKGDIKILKGDREGRPYKDYEERFAWERAVSLYGRPSRSPFVPMFW